MTTSVQQRWRLLAVAFTTACVFTSRPQLPIGDDAGADAGGTAYDAASDAFLPPPSDAPSVRDVLAPPDAFAPDAAQQADAAPASDVGSFDGSTADSGETDDCRFVATDSADGGVPDGAVVRDGGYFVNARGQPCDPMATPVDGGSRDVGVDASDASVDDLVDVAPNDGGPMDATPGDGAAAGG